MTVDRITRVNELLRREIGNLLYTVINDNDFDMSAITVTHVTVSRNLRHARVLISIRDHKNEKREMLAVIKRHRRELQERISSNIVLKYTPRLSFELDGSVEKGDHVLELLMEMEDQSDTAEDIQEQDEPEPQA